MMWIRQVGRKIMGDNTTAEALRIAERHLIKQGWKFTPKDVANLANEILKTLDARKDAADD